MLRLECIPWHLQESLEASCLSLPFLRVVDLVGVATALAEGGVNVSYMTVTRTGQGQEAIMAIGVDGTPSAEVLETIPNVPGIIEFTLFSEKGMRPLA